MRGRKMQVFDLLYRRAEPPLLAGRHPVFQRGKRRCRNQRAVVCKHGDGYERTAVVFVQQAHRIVKAVLLKVGIFDDAVIHGVRRPHHAAQVRVQV
ncbi:hypothetical protein SDC9_201622 [bioreactor metagenome]|uniref:Uncharacterized protein n=1 Tax=bioreactor metagenome TaxID=1076179 RepID=A0A645J3B0_9ZZZZ